MSEEFNEEYDYDKAAEERRIRRKKRRRRALISRIVFFVVLLLIAATAILLVVDVTLKKNGRSLGSLLNGSSHTGSITETATPQPDTETDLSQMTTESETPASTPDSDANAPVTGETGQPSTAQSESPADAQAKLDEARLMAQGYDYDGAIALLQNIPGYESIPEVTTAIADIEKSKAACVAVDVTTVPHIFYHSLINNTDAAFNVSVLGQGQVDGMNAWMTTIEEFDKITQKMYDNGYVFVRLHDLVTQTTDADGTVHFSPNTNLLLPPDKKAVVLSVDDLSYYHSYEPASYPDKLVLDENGKVKCHYVKPDGTEEIGDFDVVPRLNTFLEQHPDGAYKGARGTIALTGYNGVFGYRTDEDYETRQSLMEDQQKWLEQHPDFDRSAEIAEATKIAEALKAEGWDFASHTWGHLSVTNKTVDELRIDNEKWVNNVQNIVGPTDTIIFAHGNDIGSWEGYSDDNEKYAYFKGAGYNFFCNVDGSTPYWVQITDRYVRQGRIDLDGYMLYQSSQGATTVIDNMFKASEVFDQRRPTPVVANGES